MNQHAGDSLFRVWPYLALALAAGGFALRWLATADRLPVVKRAVPRAERVFLGGRAWRACWALIAAAHVAGLLFPRAVLGLTRTPARLLTVEAIGFAIGLGVLAACLRSAWVHARRPLRGGWSLVSDVADSAFVGLLLVAAASGLLAAAVHRWGSTWGAVAVAPYAASLVRGQPAPELVAHMPLLVRLHLFAAFAALAVLPATRLALLPIALTHRALAGCNRAIAAAARPALAWLQRGPAAWLWPEREIRWIVKPPVEVARKGAAARPTVAWPRPAVHDSGVVAIKHGDKAV